MSRGDEPSFNPEEHQGLKKTSRKNEKFQPELKQGEEAFGHGIESEVYPAGLEFTSREKMLGGLVYKKFQDWWIMSASPETLKEYLDNVLRKWDRIKTVRKELKKRGEPGFNIPAVVRGYYKPTESGAEAGLIMSDLRKDGRKDVIDVKDLPKFKAFIREDQWTKIKGAVLRDVDIGTAHGINFNSPVFTDAWLVARDRATGDCEVFLSDVGHYVAVYEGERTAEQTRALEHSRYNVASGLEHIEKELGYRAPQKPEIMI